MTLRRQPQDFEVNERIAPAWLHGLAAAWDEAHPFAVLRLSKIGLPTPDALAHACRALGVRVADASYAGLKDKHAVTAQHVTVRVESQARARALGAERDGTGWRAKLIGWSPQAISAEAIAANEFTIVVRGLNAKANDEMAQRAQWLSEGGGRKASALCIVNYFGAQRFGSARHGKGFAAQRLIEGDVLGALRLLLGTPSRKDSGRQRTFTRLCAQHWGEWGALASRLPPCAERGPFEALARGSTPEAAFAAVPKFLQGMCIEAFQSLLWNETARNMVKDLPAEGGASLVQADDEFGAMLFPRADAIPAAWREVSVPLLSPQSALEAPWAAAAQRALASFGITKDSLRVPGMERPFFGHAVRSLVVSAAAFHLSEPQPDELGKQLRRTVRFELPRGAYATVVLRALGS